MMRKTMVILIALLFLAPAALYADDEHKHTTAPKCSATIQMKSDGETDLVVVTTKCGKTYYFRMENGRYISVDKEKDVDPEA